MTRTLFGFDRRTGRHSRLLTPEESTFVGLLFINHVGRKNRISATDLAQQWALACDPKPEPDIEHWTRLVRHMQNHLLYDHDGATVLSASGKRGGYWLSVDPDEAREFYETFRRRALTGMRKAARGKKSVLASLVQQLAFGFDEPGTFFQGASNAGSADPSDKAPVEIVDAFLARMLGEPEKFADGLRKLGAKYSAVFMPREQAEAIKNQARRLLEMTADL